MSYMPLQKHEVQSFEPNESVPPPPPPPPEATSENFSSSDDEKTNSPGTDSTKSEQPDWPKDLPYRDNTTVRKAPQAGRGMIQLMKSLLLPLVAIAYLTFCYTVHDRMVPVTAPSFLSASTSPADIASVKSGITSISILIIAIGLWPLKDLVSNIKSEEFFRTLHMHDGGVPLSAINGISIPSSGMVDTVLAIVRRHCSPYLTAAFVAGLLSIATSTLSPAALSVETVLIDTDMMAFRVGSVPADSVYNVTDITPFTTTAVSSNNELSSLIAWAETFLGVRYSFAQKADPVSPYIVPSLVDLDFGVTARWLTDVVALHPACLWTKTNVSSLDYRPSNISSTPFNQTKTVLLSDVGVDLEVRSSFSAFSTPSIRMLDAEYAMSNHTSRGLLSDGSIGWEVGQCISGCRGNGPDVETVVTYNFTGIPTIQIVGADMTWEVAYLVCSPHPTIETREARSDAQGILSVHGDKKYSRQGNLHPTQMSMLLTYSIAGFDDKSGPALSVGAMGSKAQAELIFGHEQINTINTTRGAFTIAPVQNRTIADTYIRILQSITKVYLSGKLGTAYVPGRLSKPALVFRSSMSYTATSSALFALLTVFILWAHFRAGKGEQFTLARIAMVLDKSDIPFRMRGEVVDERGGGGGGGSGGSSSSSSSRADSAGQWEESCMREYGRRKVMLDKGDDGNDVLRLVEPDAGRAL